MIEAIIVNGKERKEEIINIYKSDNSLRNDFSFEESTYYVIVYEDQKAVATGSLITEQEYQIDNIFVLEDFRKKYYGDLVVKMLIDKGFKLGALEIITYTPKKTVLFFQKIGFYEKDSYENELVKLGIQQNNIKKCRH